MGNPYETPKSSLENVDVLYESPESSLEGIIEPDEPKVLDLVLGMTLPVAGYIFAEQFFYAENYKHHIQANIPMDPKQFELQAQKKAIRGQWMAVALISLYQDKIPQLFDLCQTQIPRAFNFYNNYLVDIVESLANLFKS